VVKEIGSGIEHGILSGLNDVTNWASDHDVIR
jgi:hypothetical protein